MKDFLPIILGSGINSYQVARNIYETYSINPVICDFEVKEPFIGSIYNNFYIEKALVQNDEAFIDVLKDIYEFNKDNFKKFIVFCPHEHYLNIVFKIKNKLPFDLIIPYSSYGNNFANKDSLYDILDELSLKYPKSKKINKENINLDEFEENIFIRPINLKEYRKLDFPNKEISYNAKTKNEAINIIKNIFNNGYNDEILVQEYIDGKDGNQFSINGYSNNNNDIILSQARTILTDDIGNHIVQIDSDISLLNEITEKIITKLNYKGLFNIDYKISDKDGEIYITAINARLGFTNYYTVLNNRNIIKACIDDLIFNKKEKLNHNFTKFGINIFKDEETKNFITSGLFLEYKDNERAENTVNPLLDKKDLNSERLEVLDIYLSSELNKRIQKRGINEAKYK